jgi:hypothetical protein
MLGSAILTDLAKRIENCPEARLACWNLGFCDDPMTKIGLIATNLLTLAKRPRG